MRPFWPLFLLFSDPNFFVKIIQLSNLSKSVVYYRNFTISKSGMDDGSEKNFKNQKGGTRFFWGEKSIDLPFLHHGCQMSLENKNRTPSSRTDQYQFS